MIINILSTNYALTSGNVDNSIRLWNVKTGQQKATLDGHRAHVSSVCFSPDGTSLAPGSWDNSIRLWYVKTKQQKAKLDGHSSSIFSVCFSPAAIIEIHKKNLSDHALKLAQNQRINYLILLRSQKKQSWISTSGFIR